MTDTTPKLLDKAGHAIHAAEVLLREGAEKGLDSRKHAGVHSLFGEHFAKPGLIDPKFHRLLIDAFDSRLQADYGTDVPVPAEQAMALIGTAREFLGAAEGATPSLAIIRAFPPMIVETNVVRFDSLSLDSGASLSPVEAGYETYGTLNADKSNAILILHAFSGDAHAAGISPESGKPGWWDNMIGPGKAFDTERYFVICSNVLGGCRGTTGPSSINPATGCPYAMSFPVITIKDMVRLQKMLMDYLGIERLLCVTGGSMGGMQALEWSLSYPHSVVSAIPIATTARHSAQQIAFNEVGRQAIMADPDWNEGNYYGRKPPARGLAVARMVGHITYMSDDSMREKFGRRLRSREKFGYDFSGDFEVENYLRYRGSEFVNRFDANSYLYITKAMDYFDLTNGHASLGTVFENAKARYLAISFSSDWLYPSYQSQEIVRALRGRNLDVAYCELPSNYGHDAFLVDVGEQTDLIRGFLASTFKEKT